MLISETNLKLWMDRFFGYGSWDSPVWLVGYEEGGGDLPEEVADKTNFFAFHHHTAIQPTLCDVRALYRAVKYRGEGPKGKNFDTLYDYRFGDEAFLHGAWKNLIALVHGYNNELLPDLLNYQKNHFLSSADAAMVRLYPLPSPHSHAWYYRWLVVSEELSYIRYRERYEERVYPDRMNAILTQLKRHSPKLVVMYGMNNVQRIKESFEREFAGLKFKMVKAIKLQVPQHHAAYFEGTQIVITTQVPTLRHNRVETGFDWLHFGNLIRSYRPVVV